MRRDVTGPEVAGAMAAVAACLVLLAQGAELPLLALAVASAASPLLVFAHELGHAVAVVRLTGRRALIRMGLPPYALRLAVGRIDVAYSPGGYVAHCELDPAAVISGRALLVIALAGPAANIALAGALGGVAAMVLAPGGLAFWVIAASAATSLFLAVANLVPSRGVPAWWPGAMAGPTEGLSDGYIALLAVRSGLRTLHAPPPPERFADDTRRAVLSAARSAEAAGAERVDGEHLLLGLAAQRDAPAARVLRECGIEDAGPGSSAAVGPVGFTSAAEQALDRAAGALTLRGDQLIGTEHVLLGLLEERDGSAARALASRGSDRAAVRRQLLDHLAREPAVRG